MATSIWFRNIKACRNPALRLFMFPYAGGHARVFSHWAQSLPAGVELLALQLPGRGERISEEPLESIVPLVDTLEAEFSRLNSVPFVFLGHSLGARIAFELTYRFYQRGKKLPTYFISSGARAPDLQRVQQGISNLPDQEFIELLNRIGGTPKSILENNELMQLMLPTIKADFCLAETTSPIQPVRLPVAASIFNGEEDFNDIDLQLKHWQKHFSVAINSRVFSGGHFFINEHAEQVIEVVGQQLNQLMFDLKTNQRQALKRAI